MATFGCAQACCRRRVASHAPASRVLRDATGAARPCIHGASGSDAAPHNGCLVPPGLCAAHANVGCMGLPYDCLVWLILCKDKINRREYKKNGLVFKPAPPPGRHRQSDSGRKHGRARHVVQPEQKKKCPPGLAATAPPGGHHPSCQVAVGNQPISSCSKSTDTIELAGVLYIFATILCALGPHTKV